MGTHHGVDPLSATFRHRAGNLHSITVNTYGNMPEFASDRKPINTIDQLVNDRAPLILMQPQEMSRSVGCGS